MANDIKKVLSIAGSDCSGGAGIQADIKTIIANKGYAMTAITSLTAQNTLGVMGVQDVTCDFLKLQLDACFDDIFPDSVKIGMVSSAGLIKVICDSIKEHNAKNIVVDPVMVSTSGHRLLHEDAVDTLMSSLLPLADIITPNIPEAELISGIMIKNADDMMEAASILCSRYPGAAVLIKGGHSVNDANDLLCIEGETKWIYGEKIANDNTHGTGCTLSSAIATYIARGFNIYDSVVRAKEYISGALKNGIDLGSGSGPLNHGWNIK